MDSSNWVWIPEWENRGQTKAYLVCFRRKFMADARQEEMKIQISADSRYKLYVNGKLAEIGPCKGDRLIWYYDEVDIAPFLKVGENILAVEVLRYPVNGWGNHSIIRTHTPGFYLKEVAGKHDVDTDSAWRCIVAEDFQIVSEFPWHAQLQILENRIADAKLTGWKRLEYDDTDWSCAKSYTQEQVSLLTSPGNLNPRPIPPMQKTLRNFKGLYGRCRKNDFAVYWDGMLQGEGVVEIPPHSHETVEIDAGEMMCGFLSLRIAEGAGSIIRITSSEGYVKQLPKTPGEFAVKGDRTDWENGYLYGFTDTYGVAGNGTKEQPEGYEPFWFRTFRFVKLEIETADRPLIVTGFDYLETGYPLDVRTQVRTSDNSLDAIWDISLRSLRRCMQETYTDCPFYEQLQYSMDARSQILYTYAVSGDDRLARQCMDDFRRSQRPDGTLNSCYPDAEPNVIPTFGIYYILMLYDHMMYAGDKKFLRQHLGCMDNVLNFFDRNLDERGLVGSVGGPLTDRVYWSFIDWALPWAETTGMPTAGVKGPVTMESFLYIYGLLHGADILEYMGRNDTAEEYRRRAGQVKNAVNTYCVDSKGRYMDGPGIKEYSQHCQVFALLTDTVSVEKGRKLLKESLRDTETYAACTVAMAFYLFRALEKADMYEETRAIWDLWRNMLAKHLTTCAENDLDERSDCHAWGALALYELPSVILGVRPGAPGYKKIEVCPIPGYLDHASGDVITPHGTVHVEWHKEQDGRIVLNYTLPCVKEDD
ncbi:alpha-L-rhamnosidase C-terminal domain-containing protein [Lachnospiraceae bacterium 54-11]